MYKFQQMQQRQGGFPEIRQSRDRGGYPVEGASKLSQELLLSTDPGGQRNPQFQGQEMLHPYYNERKMLLPPYSFFRKEIVSKMMVYGIDEEEGERSKMRLYLFAKYKEAIYQLRNRLAQERRMLTKLEQFLSGNLH